MKTSLIIDDVKEWLSNVRRVMLNLMDIQNCIYMNMNMNPCCPSGYSLYDYKSSLGHSVYPIDDEPAEDGDY